MSGEIVSWIGIILLASGNIILLVGFIWALILAWRENKVIFALVLLLPVVGYPLFLIKHWQNSKKSLYVILLGSLGLIIGFTLMKMTS